MLFKDLLLILGAENIPGMSANLGGLSGKTLNRCPKVPNVVGKEVLRQPDQSLKGWHLKGRKLTTVKKTTGNYWETSFGNIKGSWGHH